MTAIVGILNKSGIAIAADSAVTVTNGNGRKVLNTETKIFRLSKKHPVAVMVYDSFLFMETPWELIIKQYCRTRGERSRNTVKEYVDDFLDFLHDEDYFCSKEIQKRKLRNWLIEYYQLTRDEAKENFDNREENDDRTYNDFFVAEMEENEEVCKEEIGKCPMYEKYTFRSFLVDAEETINDIVEQGFTNEGFDVGQRDLLEHSSYEWLRSRAFLGECNSGLIFVGYGENDIFPCLYPIEVSGVFDDRLRYFVNEERIYQVDHDNVAAICPFAQADVMQTLMNGISPDIRRAVECVNKTLINEVHTSIYQKLVEANVGKEVLELVESMNFEGIQEKAENDLMKPIRQEKDKGLLDTVETFNVQELASMAESLVSITNLQRHFTSSEESVGGPVDVAVITRNEGFIWVKRKLWFSQDMNRHVINED